MLPPCVGVVLTAGAEDLPAVEEVLHSIPANCPAAFFAIVHDPVTPLNQMVSRLGRTTGLQVREARNGAHPDPGELTLACGNSRLELDPVSMTVRSDSGTPSTDRLFASVLTGFGRYLVAVVLGGVGTDGVRGSSDIAAGGGIVLVRARPAGATTGLSDAVLAEVELGRTIELSAIGSAVMKHTGDLWDELAQTRRPAGFGKQPVCI
jgi:two-component system chemotaxis response regulator CheB